MSVQHSLALVRTKCGENNILHMTTESWKAVQKSFIFNILVYIKKYYAVAGCGEVEVCFLIFSPTTKGAVTLQAFQELTHLK